VIAKTNLFIDFLDELRLLSKKNRFLGQKISVALPSAVWRNFMAVQMKILSALFLKDAFKLETSPFGSLKEF
jgi:rRNA-processing protein FCF1